MGTMPMVAGMHDHSAVTIGDLLALDILAGAECIGGQAVYSREVQMVVAGGSVREVGDLPPGALVVFDRSQLAVEDFTTDLVLRRGVTAGIVGVIAQAPERTVPLATRRLAEKFGVALILLPRVHSGSVAALLDPIARVPTIEAAAVLRRTVQRLANVDRSPAELVAALSDTLGLPVALVDGHGRLLEGDPVDLGPAVLAAIGAEPPAGAPVLVAGAEAPSTLVAPATIHWTGTGNVWFIARLPSRATAQVDLATAALQVAGICFGAYLAAEALAAEREGSRRAMLLTDILEHGDEPSPRTVARATALEWHLYGWHLAVQVFIRKSAGQLPLGGIRPALEDALAGAGVAAALVDRRDGWAFWTTHSSNPPPRDIEALMTAVRRALLAVERKAAGLTLCAGLGGAESGPAGIGRSMQAAMDAAQLARTRDVSAAVEHIDPLSIKRMLIGWYTQGPLQDIATALVAPLLAADPRGDLVRTLRCYLDHESNTTTTAAVLGLHRNTVLQRLARIRALLRADLNRAEERLAVHLAVHAVTVR